MKILPEFSLTWFSGFLLIIPMLLLRYGWMAHFGKNASERAYFIPPLVGKERTAFVIYNISTLLLLLYPPFLSIKTDRLWLGIGIPLYMLGLILMVFSIRDFARPNQSGMLTQGVYQYSRNPIYVAYFLVFTGCGFITTSWLYLFIALIKTAAEYWVVLSEERWCVEKFGTAYTTYMQRVSRYAGRKPA